MVSPSPSRLTAGRLQIVLPNAVIRRILLGAARDTGDAGRGRRMGEQAAARPLTSPELLARLDRLEQLAFRAVALSGRAERPRPDLRLVAPAREAATLSSGP